MITSELISYIRKQIDNNISKDLIISNLIEAGWRMEDIQEAFSNIKESEKPKIVEELIPTLIQKTSKNDVVENIILEEKKEPIQPIQPILTTDKTETETEIIVQNQELESKNELPELKIYINEENTTETPVIVEKLKVWTPMNIPVKENVEIEKIEKIEEREKAVQRQEFQIKEEPVKQRETTDIFNKTPNLIILKDINKKEEALTTLGTKTVINSFDSINKENKENLIKRVDAPIALDEKPKESFIKNLPQTAMLSSYQDDLSSAIKIKEEENKKRRQKVQKRIITIIAILSVALTTWVFAKGFIRVPFVKNDPKILLLNNSKVLSSLKSYKTETNVEISSPSFANIASGLITGEAVTSKDKDSISLNTLGVINQDAKGLFSDNFITIKGSLLQNYITTDIKNNGTDLFVSVPDLSQILEQNAPKSSIVKINEEQFNLIPSLFSPTIESILNKLNLYEILSRGMSSYIDNKTLGVYDEFINSTDITEKNEENIKGIETYHYSINTDRQLAKKLLSEISSNFVLSLSDDDKNKLDQIVGSVIVDSLDIWIGKGDNNIYQYNVVLDIPLSKIIGFEDKSIGDNKVSIDWKTTYYDFNIANNIVMPNVSIPAIYFVDFIKETKIKNEVSSFKKIATDLFKIEKAYGKKPNPSGSCMQPVQGSLFSPTGHPKDTTTMISSISMFLNKILETTKNAGYCYSTTKDWSFAIPISDNYSLSPTQEYKSFFCIDNTGSAVMLTAPPTGVVCLPTAIPTGQ